MNMLFKLLLVWLMAFGVFVLYVDVNTPTLKQIKNQKYAETLSWIEQTKIDEAKARWERLKLKWQKMKLEQWTYVCVNFKTEQTTYLDDVQKFRLSNDCQTTETCFIKDDLSCIPND